MKVHRSFFRAKFSERETALDFLVDSELLAPASILRMFRMSLFVRLIFRGHYDILSALYLAKSGEKCFISALTADSKFLMKPGRGICRTQRSTI